MPQELSSPRQALKARRSGPWDQRRKCVWGAVARAILIAACLAGSAATAAAQSYALSWDRNADPHTVGYRVYGGAASGNYSWSIDAGNATTASLPALSGGATYYFVVRAYNSIGQLSAASAEVSLDLAAPEMPTGVSATATGSRVTLSWLAPPTGASVSQYLVSVGTAPGASNIVSQVSVGRQTSASGDLPPGRYFARVQGANSYGIGAPSADVSFIVGGPDQPGAPSALSVAWQGTIATFRWNPGSGAAAYVLEAGSASGTSNIGVINVGAGTQFSIDVPPGAYYVRVRSANALGMSGPSNELLVRGPGAPSSPTALSATSTASSVTLRWNAPGTGTVPSGYVLEVGSAPGAANLAVVQLGAQTSYVAAAPPAGTYYVRVRAVNSRGASGPSNEIVIRR